MDNVSLKTSRVVVYKHTSLVAKVREDLMSEWFSSIWLEVGFPGRRKFLVCNLYREWQYMGQGDASSLDMSEQLARWIILLEQWEKALDSGKECVVMGDFNLDFLSFNSSQACRLKPLIDELLVRVVPHGVRQCVVGPTRQGRMGQVDSGLDHVWTNTPGKMSPIYTKYFGSDHKVIMGVRYASMVTTGTRYVKKRSFKEFEESDFLHRVRSTSWWEVYRSTDTDEAVNIFTNKVNYILDQVAPMKTFQVRTKYCPWLSIETKELIKERNKAQAIFSENKTDFNFNKFKNIRNKVTNALKKEKLQWQKQKLKSCNKDPGMLWKNVLGWLNWSSSGSPSKLYYAGEMVSSPGKLAYIMNNFFVSKISSIRQNLQPPADNPLRTLKKITEGSTARFTLACIHPDAVRKIICGLKNSKASGVDGIDTYILKLMVDDVLPVITHIVNLSIQQGVFPTMYKQAKVIPLLKKGDPLEPKNYRPVALLCIVSKVIERAIFLQIVEHMNTQGLFHPNHHGFRAGHSTTTAMIQMYDNWVQAVDKGDLVGVCMLDMSAAFDVVEHSILLEKLKLYGFDAGALKWMKNYLSGRTQAVYVDGALSSFLDVNIGVPQGSILGPLCYILYTNDLPETVFDSSSHVHWSKLSTHCGDCGSLCCFADDSTYSISNKSQELLKQKLNEKYKIMASYMCDSRLKLNDDKTHLLIMTTRNRRKLPSMDIQINATTEEIKPIKSEKLLGIIIQEDLKWTEYIQNHDKSLIKQLSARVSALKLVSKFSTFKVRLMVANGIFISKLIFQISLWGGAAEYLLDSLQIVQNKAARFVTRRGIYTPRSELLKHCGWLSVRQLVIYHSVILIHKTILTKAPRYIYDKLSSEFPYNTRLAESEALRMGPEFQAKLEITRRSFMHRGTSYYNLLPADLRKVRKLEDFKVKVKTWVADNFSI